MPPCAERAGGSPLRGSAWPSGASGLRVGPEAARRMGPRRVPPGRGPGRGVRTCRSAAGAAGGPESHEPDGTYGLSGSGESCPHALRVPLPGVAPAVGQPPDQGESASAFGVRAVVAELGKPVAVGIVNLQEQVRPPECDRDSDLGVGDPAVGHRVGHELVRRKGDVVGEFVGDPPVREGLADAVACGGDVSFVFGDAEGLRRGHGDAIPPDVSSRCGTENTVCS